MAIADSLILQLNTFTEEELFELNKIIITNIKAAQARKMASMRNTLSVGDTVTFTGRDSGRGGRRYQVTGAVTKIKRKRAEVNCFSRGLTWNVNIGNLTRVKVEILRGTKG